jgi:hypothetical protein
VKHNNCAVKQLRRSKNHLSSLLSRPTAQDRRNAQSLKPHRVLTPFYLTGKVDIDAKQQLVVNLTSAQWHALQSI